MKPYNPKPVDLSDVVLTEDLNELREAISHIHLKILTTRCTKADCKSCIIISLLMRQTAWYLL